MKGGRSVSFLFWVTVVNVTTTIAFVPETSCRRSQLSNIQHCSRVHNEDKIRSSRVLSLKSQSDDSSVATTNEQIWNPKLRKAMGGVAALGGIETAYLTLTKLSGGSVEALCGTDGGCGSVLDGPYANIPFTDIPLATLGLIAYSTTAFLALAPLMMSSDQSDSDNRVLLTGVTTAMGTFSVFLMSLLFGVMHTSCAYCITSAILSISLAKMAWLGGCLPETSGKTGATTAAGSFLASVVVSVLVFVNGDSASASMVQFAGSAAGGSTSSSLLAASSSDGTKPPAITMSSSDRAMALADSLRSLDARMYGAFWCSHCYDQKEVLGKEAFSKLQYVECSKDGYKSQNALCKEKKVPGYPTWEINGQLFPGQQELEELEEIVQQFKQ